MNDSFKGLPLRARRYFDHLGLKDSEDVDRAVMDGKIYPFSAPQYGKTTHNAVLDWLGKNRQLPEQPDLLKEARELIGHLECSNPRVIQHAENWIKIYDRNH